MARQAQQQTHGGVTVYRWRLETSAGPKIVWAPSPATARAKVEAQGTAVTSIRPSESMDYS